MRRTRNHRLANALAADSPRQSRCAARMHRGPRPAGAPQADASRAGAGSGSIPRQACCLGCLKELPPACELSLIPPAVWRRRTGAESRIHPPSAGCSGVLPPVKANPHPQSPRRTTPCRTRVRAASAPHPWRSPPQRTALPQEATQPRGQRRSARPFRHARTYPARQNRRAGRNCRSSRTRSRRFRRGCAGFRQYGADALCETDYTRR